MKDSQGCNAPATPLPLHSSANNDAGASTTTIADEQKSVAEIVEAFRLKHCREMEVCVPEEHVNGCGDGSMGEDKGLKQQKEASYSLWFRMFNVLRFYHRMIQPLSSMKPSKSSPTVRCWTTKNKAILTLMFC